MQDTPKLFDHCLLFTLKHQQCTTKPVAPVIKWHFPSTISQAFISSISEFCFPDASKFATQSKPTLKVETFSFVLTESSGKRRWGYCRRKMLEDKTTGERCPACFCLLSFMPCFSIFSNILDEVISLVEDCTPQSLRDGDAFLHAISQQPLPPPGGSISVPLPQVYYGKSHFLLERPNDCDSLLDHVNFFPMLELIDPKHITSLFLSLLLERRIILLATHVTVLSNAVQAFVALLYPFTWQHIFIPILPASLLHFCCAPMPFFVGVLRSSLDELQRMSTAGLLEKEIIVFDIDNDRYLSDFSFQDLQLLHSRYSAPLIAHLTNWSKIAKNEKTLRQKIRSLKQKKEDKVKKKKEARLANSKEISSIFISFMVDLTASYRRFIIFEEGVDQFQKQQFFEAQPADLRQYLELLTQTQMFEVFIRERALTKKLNSGEFEQRVTAMEKAASSRFTLYERGLITRDDILKSEAEIQERLRKEQEKSFCTEIRKRGGVMSLPKPYNIEQLMQLNNNIPVAPPRSGTLTYRRVRRRSLDGSSPLEIPISNIVAPRDKMRAGTQAEGSDNTEHNGNGMAAASKTNGIRIGQNKTPVSRISSRKQTFLVQSHDPARRTTTATTTTTPSRATFDTKQPNREKGKEQEKEKEKEKEKEQEKGKEEEDPEFLPFKAMLPVYSPTLTRRARRVRGSTHKRHSSVDGENLLEPGIHLLNKDVLTWTAEDVNMWLAGLGLRREGLALFTIVFSRIKPGGIDGPALLALTPDDVKPCVSLDYPHTSPTTTTPTTTPTTHATTTSTPNDSPPSTKGFFPGWGEMRRDVDILFAGIVRLQHRTSMAAAIAELQQQQQQQQRQQRPQQDTITVPPMYKADEKEKETENDGKS